MKTLKFKLALPIMAIAFAVSAAFAGQKTNDENLALEQGYVHTSEPCKKSMECNPSGLIQCTTGTDLVYGIDSSSGCGRPLFFN